MESVQPALARSRFGRPSCQRPRTDRSSEGSQAMLPVVFSLAVLGAPEVPRETPPPDRVAEVFARASPEHKIARLMGSKRYWPALDIRGGSRLCFRSEYRFVFEE